MNKLYNFLYKPKTKVFIIKSSPEIVIEKIKALINNSSGLSSDFDFNDGSIVKNKFSLRLSSGMTFRGFPNPILYGEINSSDKGTQILTTVPNYMGESIHFYVLVIIVSIFFVLAFIQRDIKIGISSILVMVIFTTIFAWFSKIATTAILDRFHFFLKKSFAT